MTATATKKPKKAVAKKAPARRKITPLEKALTDANTEGLIESGIATDSADYYGPGAEPGWIRPPAVASYAAKFVDRKVAYLGGPMTGLPNFNFEAFHEATKFLRDEVKLDVFSPAEHDEANGFDPTLNSLDGFSLTDAMRWDIGAILMADMVIMLPGWEASSGCAIEATVARAIGIPILQYPSLAPVTDESICAEADRIVSGARQSTYGHPITDFTRTAGMWEAYLGVPVRAEDVPVMMILLKASRLANSPTHRDSMVDIAGYAKTADLVRTRRIEDAAHLDMPLLGSAA